MKHYSFAFRTKDQALLGSVLNKMKDFKYSSVLLIDDSYIDNLINRKIIEASNFAEKITVIESPFRAIDFLTESAGTEDAPDIIFLDIRMPGMNGFELVEQLNEIKQKFYSDLKIYMLSSSLDPNDLKQVEDNDLVTNFIGKPLTTKVLEEI
ncbi:response regulator [Pararcticibacter amylolyticus]|uniref:Response regulator n=1 Tax=Pararcticibacter amylolyticus TaxID=2173175 RepID=A0A2U2PI03_9SPHI|nr:response regulator [Pararcticibacter amylolyticus]PWG81021.1 response regulator [Pararcticibacter amylolyticus]